MGPTQLLQLKAILGEAASEIENLHEAAHRDAPMDARTMEVLAKLQAASDLLEEEVLTH